jgi:uncharacterized protein (TIGR00725 family)
MSGKRSIVSGVYVCVCVLTLLSGARLFAQGQKPATPPAQAAPAQSSPPPQHQPAAPAPSAEEFKVLKEKVEGLDQHTRDAVEASRKSTEWVGMVATIALTVTSLFVVLLVTVGGYSFLKVGEEYKQEFKEKVAIIDKQVETHDKALKEQREAHEASWRRDHETFEERLEAMQKMNNEQERNLSSMRPFNEIDDEMKDMEARFTNSLNRLRSDYESPKALKMWALAEILKAKGETPIDTALRLANEIGVMVAKGVDDNSAQAAVPLPVSTPAPAPAPIPVVSIGLGQKRRLPVVGVMGSGKEEHPDLTGPLGRELARMPVHLLTGGGLGTMTAVSRAFAAVPDRQGLVLGVIPAHAAGPCADYKPKDGYPNEWVDVPIYTHLPGGGNGIDDPITRNHINVLSADVVIVLPGGPGTEIERRLATAYGKPLVLFTSEDQLEPVLTAVRTHLNLPSASSSS